MSAAKEFCLKQGATRERVETRDQGATPLEGKCLAARQGRSATIGTAASRHHLITSRHSFGIFQMASWQIEAAKKGNAKMLIWLGKQLREQSDKVEAASAVTLKATAPAKLTPEDETFLKRKVVLVGGEFREVTPINRRKADRSL